MVGGRIKSISAILRLPCLFASFSFYTNLYCALYPSSTRFCTSMVWVGACVSIWLKGSLLAAVEVDVYDVG